MMPLRLLDWCALTCRATTQKIACQHGHASRHGQRQAQAQAAPAATTPATGDEPPAYRAQRAPLWAAGRQLYGATA
jgi:hypothetical protein